MITHVFDNIDWKNKNIKRTGRHHTNSIFVQKYNSMEDLAKINSIKKQHQYYKIMHQYLPSVNFKRERPKSFLYPSHNDHKGYDRSSIKRFAWIYDYLHKNDLSNNQKIFTWSAFQELST